MHIMYGVDKFDGPVPFEKSFGAVFCASRIMVEELWLPV